MSYFYIHTVKPGSQYDAGTASIVSNTGKNYLLLVKFYSDVKFFNTLIGWILANAGNATPELSLVHNLMLVPA